MEIDARRAAPLVFETVEGIPTKPHVFEQVKSVSPKQARSAAGWVSPNKAASSLKTPSMALASRTSFSKFKSRVGALGPCANEDIHVYACSVMAHVMTYRNTTRVSELIGAMPKSFRRRDLIDWFERYIPLKIAYATGKVTYISKAASDEWKQFVEGFEATWKKAIDTPFWFVQ
ncbi:hypothetical protein [Candidatus Thiodictyon syntrophicum]|jgi:hypothetical protein|nr:hypothetical protein [Candidatus Thiodictyon syntrophicum]